MGSYSLHHPTKMEKEHKVESIIYYENGAVRSTIFHGSSNVPVENLMVQFIKYVWK